jgi:phage/plasmid-associated DNA primase
VDGGTWRRIKVVDFPNKFVHEPKMPNEHPIDETIMEKTGSAEWAACFMAYLVHLYTHEIPKHPGLVPPKEVDAYTSEYKSESDVIAQFIDEHVHVRESTEETAIMWSTIAEAFREWKRRNDISRGNAQDLKKRLDERFGKYPRNGWVGFTFGAA